MANKGWVVQARGVELSFSRSPEPLVRCSRWAGGLQDGVCVVNENNEAPGEARSRPPFEDF